MNNKERLDILLVNRGLLKVEKKQKQLLWRALYLWILRA